MAAQKQRPSALLKALHDNHTERMPLPERQSRRAIILGGGAKAKNLDLKLCFEPDVEIWGINMQFSRSDWVPYHSRMFHVHKYELLKKYGWPVASFAEWTRDHPSVKVFTADKWPDGRMARAQVFPREEMAARFPRSDYHCNSLDWLIAYALFLDFKEVRLHGFNLEREGVIEQMAAARCAEYWSGFAEGRGMKLIAAEDTSIFGVYHLVKTNRVYGYDDCPAWEDHTPNGKDPPYRYDEY